MSSTKESAVKRDLRTPKYRMRVEEDRKKESKKNLDEDQLDLLEDMAVCYHGFLAGCPHCKGE